MENVVFGSFGISDFKCKLCLEQKDNLTTRPGDKRKSDAVPPCRLFGIDLNSTSAGSTIEISKAAVEGCFSKTPSFGDSEQKSDLSIDTKGLKQEQSQVTQPKEGQTNQNSSIRSRTKVQMQGVAVGRAVDLTAIKGYDELTSELEDMFEIHGELRPRKSGKLSSQTMRGHNAYGGGSSMARIL
ncbi:auxin response factor 9-like [Ipomoea triloba]|uniref:auxin response factor 9-like n=1 Tax=Ipomoea triloba TaxID=35885 RepID=UPI00125D0935|nr:auxin response factor 9-like [Ipomoea triloba]